ncbi:MAG: aldo/keto reductase [Pseudomonadota bacterium]
MDSPATMKVGHGTMPCIGMGLWKLDNAQAADAVYEAIKIGYRHLDSACDYGNEKEVGAGIKRALDEKLCTRDELWITSKLWNTDHRKEHVRPALNRTLDDLGLDYLDLYLVHFPIALEHVPHDRRYPAEWLFDPTDSNPSMKIDAVPLHHTWSAMEELVADGGTRSIGVCNYSSALMHDLLSYARIKPAMLQIESHPYCTQEPLLRLCKERDIPVTAFSPLGALSYLQLDMASPHESVLKQEVVKAAALRVNRSAAQVVLRWGIQRGTAIIPKSSKPARLKENLALFDFELTDKEMSEISALNANRRFNDPGVFCEAAFNTFHPIYD